VAAYAVTAVCCLAAVLVPVGLWHPALVLPLLALTAALWISRHRFLDHGRRPSVIRESVTGAPGWAAWACMGIAVGFTVWAAATRAEHVVLRRDAGSYALFAQWLATDHGLPVDARLDAFGGPAALAIPGLTVDSPAFYQVSDGAGVDVVPQFLLGAPALFSLGWWAGGGWTGLLLVPALLGGLAVLAAAGLTARLLGPAWAPVAALALAVSQPVLHAARSTYSEPAALLLVLAAASLAVDAVRAGEASADGDPARSRRLGLAAGLVLGLAGLVRVDSLREVALLVPCCAVLALRRHPAAGPMALGALAGSVVAAVPAVLLSRPYLETNRSSVVPLAAGTVAVVVVSALAVLAGRRLAGRRPDPGRRPRVPGAAAERMRSAAPALAAATVALIGVLLATRPWWAVGHVGPDDAAVALVRDLQQQQGLAVDGTRNYTEDSLRWTAWYLGWPAVLAGWAALCVLAARGVRALLQRQRDGSPAPVPPWLLPAAVGLGATVLTLYRPGITPDHPWADRRLVVIVLPTLVIAATAAGAAAARAVAGRATDRRRPVTAAAVALLVLPAVWATLPLAASRTEVGQPGAVAQVCAALSPSDAVVAVDGTPAGAPGRTANEWPQVVRGVCGVPTVTLRPPAAQLPAALARLDALTAAAGRRLVVLHAPPDLTTGGQPPVLDRLGLTGRLAVRLATTEDQRVLQRRPDDVNQLGVEVWTAPWPR